MPTTVLPDRWLTCRTFLYRLSSLQRRTHVLLNAKFRSTILSRHFGELFGGQAAWTTIYAWMVLTFVLDASDREYVAMTFVGSCSSCLRQWIITIIRVFFVKLWWRNHNLIVEKGTYSFKLITDLAYAFSLTVAWDRFYGNFRVKGIHHIWFFLQMLIYRLILWIEVNVWR